MIATACVTLVLCIGSTSQVPALPAADTLRLEVGSAEVDARWLPPHLARNRVYVGGAETPTSEWTNELTLGDSAGISVMRWVTRGRQRTADGGEATWELRQTYNARTLAPLAYSNTSSTGAHTRFTIDGNRLRGARRLAGQTEEQALDRVLDRLGFMVNASDLVPMGVGLEAGTVTIAPVWGVNMEAPEDRIFAVLGEETVSVEGAEVTAWKVEERVASSGDLVANWYLTESPPYMVYAEVMLPNGQVQRITGVSLDP
jgi:hypothetical protein